MSLAIKVEDLSKAYQLGEIGTGTLSRDLERWFAKVRGKEDPFLKIGEANDRAVKGTSDVVWSLKDINFEIEQGDAVGIIGRNGAGKSTLLKLLSRVTSPSTGNIKVKGRIASLLEVGTGFHPELTGRENIYLNGAILGMRKKEIARKFDEILDFSGVERYVDTPVKRYSSGMYVRLAFAVAAHLESEILIVDEVLAVGDMEFQQKCLGKMGEVSKGEGRTVLFVSHNMVAVKQLCAQGIILKNGKVEYSGTCSLAIEKYNRHQNTEIIPLFNLIKKKHAFLKITEIFINGSFSSPIKINQNKIHIFLRGTALCKMELNIELYILSNENVLITMFSPGHINGELITISEGDFIYEKEIFFPGELANGEYYATIAFACPNVEVFVEMEEVRIIKDSFITKTGRGFNYNEIGFFLMNSEGDG